MGIRWLHTDKIIGLLGLIITVQLIWGYVSPAMALSSILPGRGIGLDFHLGEDVSFSIHRFELNSGIQPGAVPGRYGRSILLRNIGIKLYHANSRISQIVIYNTNLSTDRYVRVYSPVEAVYSAYGRPTGSKPLPGGYYLRFDTLGIGFDVDGRSDLIRAIVIYYPRR